MATALAAPQVEVSTLDGRQQTGPLAAITPQHVTLAAEPNVNVPLSELLEVRFLEKGEGDDASGGSIVQMTDGSRLTCKEVAASSRKVSLVGAHLGSFEVAPTAVTSIQFVPADDRIAGEWQKLLARTLKRDLLVIRKGDVLDFQDGIVGDIDGKVVKFLLEGEELPIPREKVFGVIYARRQPSRAKPVCRVTLGRSDELFVGEFAWDGKTAQAKLLDGSRVELSLNSLRSLDFSLGKVLYLSQIEPREVKYTPFFDITWEYRRDRNLDGGPIRVGKKEYARGLAIHSRTLLRYRIGGEYRRFQTVMGIDESVAGTGRADVHVVISGDGKALLEADVRAADAPRTLDLDVAGVRDLEILVDFGGDLDISDHLDLADARVIK
ncbi:MAG: NPCBM/NEW2 domain-containing protein [Planctomycetaceae bacterium]